MRIAIFSDVHGNLTALEAVLDDINDRDVDAVIFAGDLCVIGPRPFSCVELLRAAGCMAIYGNTDEWLLGRQEPPAHLQDLAAWTSEQLSSEQRAWLNGLPFEYWVTPPDNGAPLLVVHANPQDVNRLIFPPEQEQLVRYGRVRQPDSDVAVLVADCTARQIAFGHLHLPFVRQWQAKTLYDISSVSMPGDGDSRAKYGLFTWEGERWAFERRFVTCDWTAEADAYRQARPPGWQRFVETIAAEGHVPQNV